MRPEGLSHWKIPVTPSGIKPATFRFVAHCKYCVCFAYIYWVKTNIWYKSKTYKIYLRILKQKIPFLILRHFQRFIRGSFIEQILTGRVLDYLNHQNLILLPEKGQDYIWKLGWHSAIWGHVFVCRLRIWVWVVTLVCFSLFGRSQKWEITCQTFLTEESAVVSSSPEIFEQLVRS
jgi:hypothetical protein